jgi:hypothetical protein
MARYDQVKAMRAWHSVNVHPDWVRVELKGVALNFLPSLPILHS